MSELSYTEWARLIEIADSARFLTIVKEYLKLYYAGEFVSVKPRITDGPYDGGNDLVIKENGREIHRNLQVTTEKKENFERKLKSDLTKAQNNVTKHDYPPYVDYFYNKAITNASRTKDKLMARRSYGLDLNLIDSTELAQFASEEPRFHSFLKITFGIATASDSDQYDKDSRVLFDILAHHTQLAEIKKEFVHAFILAHAFAKNKVTAELLAKELQDRISSKEVSFYKNKLDYLKSKGKLETPHGNTVEFELSSEAREEISRIYESSLMSQKILEGELATVLLDAGLLDCEQEVVHLLHTMYAKNYQFDVKEVLAEDTSFATGAQGCADDICAWLRKKGIRAFERQVDIATQILGICAHTDYLSKMSAATVFTSLYKDEMLEDYLKMRVTRITLDTPVLFRVLFYYNMSPQQREAMRMSNDAAFNGVADLIEATQGHNITLQTMKDYVEELVRHLQEASRLSWILSLPFFESMGKSLNVFYDFFIALNPSSRTDTEAFEAFLREFIPPGIDDIEDEQTSKQIEDYLIGLLEMLKIPTEDHGFHPDEEFFDHKKNYEIVLAHHHKDKSGYAIVNDVRAILYMVQEGRKLLASGSPDECCLVTWDTSFAMYWHECLKKKGTDWTHWKIYTPSKVADRLSLISLKVNPAAVTNDIIAIMDSRYESASHGVSFIDIIARILPKQTSSRFAVAKKLTDLNNEVIVSHQTSDFFASEEVVGSPLATVLSNVVDHYQKEETPFSSGDFFILFEDESNLSEIFSALRNALAPQAPRKERMEGLYEVLNGLIEKQVKSSPLWKG